MRLLLVHMKPRALACKSPAISYSRACVPFLSYLSPRKCYQCHDIYFHDSPNSALSFTPSRERHGGLHVEHCA